MKSVMLNAPNDITIVDTERPKRKQGEVLIKVKAVGVCGSDIGAFRGANPLVSYPRIIGHEVAGEIMEADSATSEFKVGDRVILDPYRYCGKCYPCSIGRTNCCENLEVIGVHIDGGMQEYLAYPEDMLIKVPDNIPWEQVPLAEPLTIALHAIHRTQLKAGEHIAINGAGAIGILIALVAISYGATPILIDLVEERLAFARKHGITKTINITQDDLVESVKQYTGGRMSEVVVEASGANEAIRNTLKIASFAGRIALTGWPKKETSLPTDIITKKELDLVGSRVSVNEFEEALELISTDRVQAKVILSKVVKLEEIPEMVIQQSANPDKYLKVNAVL